MHTKLTYDISVVITAHREGKLLAATLQSVEHAAHLAKAGGLKVEIVTVLDNGDEETRRVLSGALNIDQIITVSFGDPGLSRNEGIQASRGQMICLVDGDNLVSRNWLIEAAKLIRENLGEKIIVHAAIEITFGEKQSVRRNVPQSSEEFNVYELLYRNYWDVACLAPREVFSEVPFLACDSTLRIGYEDWHWNCETIARDWRHESCAGTIYFRRIKKVGSLNLKSELSAHTIAPHGLWEKMRRDEKDAGQTYFNKRSVGVASFSTEEQNAWRDEISFQAEIDADIKELLEQKLEVHRPEFLPPVSRLMFFPELYRRTKQASEIWILDAITPGSLAQIKPTDSKSNGLIILVGSPERGEYFPEDLQKPGLSIVDIRHSFSKFEPEECLQILLRVLIDSTARQIFFIDSRLGEGIMMRYAKTLGDRAKTISTQDQLETSLRISMISETPDRIWINQAEFYLQASEIFRGNIENIKIDERGLNIRGWCLDVPNQKPVREIYCFAGTEPIALRLSFTERLDLATQYGDWSKGAGFVATAYLLPKDLTIEQINLVAISPSRQAACLRQSLPSASMASWIVGSEARSIEAITRNPSKILKIATPFDLHINGSAEIGIFKERAILFGWAADFKSQKPFDAILVFCGEKSILTLPIRDHRPDVADKFKLPALQRSGFSEDVSHLKKEELNNLRLFCVDQKMGLAGEMPYRITTDFFPEEPRAASATLGVPTSVSGRVYFLLRDSNNQGSAFIKGEVTAISAQILELNLSSDGNRYGKVNLTKISDTIYRFWSILTIPPPTPGRDRNELLIHFRANLEDSGRVSGTLGTAQVLERFDSRDTIPTSLTHSWETQLNEFLSQDSGISFPKCLEPVLSIVVILFNRAEITLNTIRALERYLPEKSELIIIDNDSTDRTSELLSRISGSHIVRNKTNVHFNRAANQGAALAKGKYLLFLNSDCEVAPDCIQRALKRIESDEKIGVVGIKLVNVDRTLQEAGFLVQADYTSPPFGFRDDPERPRYNFVRRVAACSGAFLLTRRELFHKLHGFDPKLEPAYFEDIDYCLRVGQVGKSIVYEPRSTAVHVRRASPVSEFAHLKLFSESEDQFRKMWAGKLPEALVGKSNLKNRHAVVLASTPISAEAPIHPELSRLIGQLNTHDTQVSLFLMKADPRHWSEVYQMIPDDVEVALEGQAFESLEHYLISLSESAGDLHYSETGKSTFTAIDPILWHPGWVPKYHPGIW